MLADADRLHNTVDQVLKAGVLREKPGATGARAAVVDMAALARECVELALLRHHLQPPAVELQIQQGASLLVRGDAEELRTVLANLLDNAVKYSGTAGPGDRGGGRRPSPHIGVGARAVTAASAFRRSS